MINVLPTEELAWHGLLLIAHEDLQAPGIHCISESEFPESRQREVRRER